MASTYGNIANVLYELGKKEEAKGTMKKALEIFEKIGDKPNAERAKGNLEKWEKGS